MRTSSRRLLRRNHSNALRSKNTDFTTEARRHGGKPDLSFRPSCGRLRSPQAKMFVYLHNAHQEEYAPHLLTTCDRGFAGVYAFRPEMSCQRLWQSYES